MEALRGDVDRLVEGNGLGASGEHREIFEAYRMFAYDKGWRRRLDEAVESGLSAEVAVEKVQSDARARMERVADPYIRERLHDFDDLANRLLRHLVGADDAPELPKNAVLVARNIGPGELMEHAGKIVALILEEGSLTSHAAIVARALAVPMVIQAERITRDANPGDRIVVDGDIGRVDLRPEGGILDAFREKVMLAEQARAIYRTLRDKPATTLDGVTVRLKMNAGVLADLPSINASGAEGVGLYRTELQFMQPARPRSAGGGLFAGARRRRRARGGVPHSGYRLGQDPALYAPRAGIQPGAGLARDPGRAGPAEDVPDANPVAGQGRQGAAPEHHVPDGRRGR
jgi:phosphotransferase system enzyme I (PtsP)